MTVHAAYDVDSIRADFPILGQTVHGHPLVYLDNANTTQKPQIVLDTLQDYYQRYNANIHRSVYQLSEVATQAYEATRDKIQAFIHAQHREEIIFVKGATEAINLVASSFGQQFVNSGDEILVSEMEHHANIVPWQLLCERTGAQLVTIPITDRGELDLEAYEKRLSPRTRLIAITHISNVLGTINPLRTLITRAHAQGIPVLVDGAQAVPHQVVDVQALDCDFYVFSGHKLYAPTGVGVLYGKKSWLDAMPPYQTGGSMIREVSFQKTTFGDLPEKFEAGTANIASVIGLGAAIDYISVIGLSAIAAHEHTLLQAASAELMTIPNLRILGTATQKAGVIAFTLKDIHPHDIATSLDYQGIAVRAGHHCAMPLMARFGVPATIRISFGLYNTLSEVDALLNALHHTRRLFHV